MTDETPPPQHNPEQPQPPQDSPAAEASALPGGIPSVEPDEPPPPPPPPPPQRPRASLVPWIYALGAVVLGWALMFLWVHPTSRGPSPGESQRVEALTAQVQTLSGQQKQLADQQKQLADQQKQLAARPAGEPQTIAAMQQQLAALAARKPPEVTAPPDLGPLQQKVADLQNQVSALAKAPAPQPQQNGAGGGQAANGAFSQKLAAVEQSTAALEQRVAGIEALSQRVDALNQHVDGLNQQVSQLGGLGQRVEQLRQRIDQLAQEQHAVSNQVHSLQSGQTDAQNGLSRRIDAQAADIADLRTALKHVQSTTGQAGRVMRIQTAFAALDAGRPLGDIPDAPPAVKRFADQPPPTLASLRQSFPAAADAALAVSRPSTDNKPFLDRVWTRAQDLVTVRQGDHVIVGDPASGIIDHARAALDAGDLAGTVQTLETLSGPAAQAVAPWVQQAKQLLAARAGLFDLAGQTQ